MKDSARVFEDGSLFGSEPRGETKLKVICIAETTSFLDLPSDVDVAFLRPIVGLHLFLHGFAVFFCCRKGVSAVAGGWSSKRMAPKRRRSRRK